MTALLFRFLLSLLQVTPPWWARLAGVAALFVLGVVLNGPDGPQRTWNDVDGKPAWSIDATAPVFSLDGTTFVTTPASSDGPRVQGGTIVPHGTFYARYTLDTDEQPIIAIHTSMQDDAVHVLHGQFIDNIEVAWSPDGQYIAVGESQEPGLQMWNTTTGQSMSMPPDILNASKLIFGPDSHVLFFAMHQNQQLRLLRMDIPTSTIQYNVPRQRGTHLIVSPDGRWLLLRSNDTQLTLYNAATGEQRWLMTNGEAGTDPGMRLPVWWLSRVAFSPDGQYLAIGESHEYSSGAPFVPGRSGYLPLPARIAIVRTSDGQVVQRLSGAAGWAGPIAFSTDSTMLLARGTDNFALWRIAPWPWWRTPLIPWALAGIIALHGIALWAVKLGRPCGRAEHMRG